MSDQSERSWLDIARELQAMGQIGLTFNQNEYDRRNYQRLLEMAAEITEAHTYMNKAEILEQFSIQPGYATAKIDVRGAVIRGGQLLLVKEKVDGLWTMPGGWADVGENPASMVAREVLEESGFIVRPFRVVGVFDANRGGRPMEFYHAYKIVFLCEITGGEATPSHETLEVAFFDPAHLPPLSKNRTNERHVAEVLAHLSDPCRPAFFD